MKWLKTTVIIFLLVAAIPIQTSHPLPRSNPSISSTIFYEDFENYPLGKFTSTEDWALALSYDTDPENQRIVDITSVSATRSLQLGAEIGTIFLSREFECSSNLIGYQVFVMRTGSYHTVTRALFIDSVSEIGLCMVEFQLDDIHVWAYDSGFGRSRWHWLQSCEANEWYNITAIIDTASLEFSLWINGDLKGNFQEDPDTSIWRPIDYFQVRCGHAKSNKVYLDDISVFEEPEQPTEETSLEITSIDYKEWNEIYLPFDTEGAKEFIDGFRQDGYPPKNYGTVPVNITLKNTGGHDADNVRVECTISCDIVLVKFSGVSIEEYNVITYSPPPYDYPLLVGSINSKTEEIGELAIPVKYISIATGSIFIDQVSDTLDELELPVLISTQRIEVSIKVSGTNTNIIQKSIEFNVYANPEGLLIESAKIIIDRIKEEAFKESLEDFLEYQVALAQLEYDVETELKTGIPTGERYLHHISIPLEKKPRVEITAMWPKLIELTELTVNLITVGGVATMGIVSSAIHGIATIVVKPEELQHVTDVEVYINTREQIAFALFGPLAASSETATLLIRKITISRSIADFEIVCSDPLSHHRTVEQGQTATYTLRFRGIDGSRSKITLWHEPISKYITITFDINEFNLTDQYQYVEVEIQTTTSTPLGEYDNIIINATNGAVSHSITLVATVRTEPASPGSEQLILWVAIITLAASVAMGITTAYIRKKKPESMHYSSSLIHSRARIIPNG